MWFICLILSHPLFSGACLEAGRPLRASSLGRWNGIAYYVALGIPVVRDSLGLGWPSAWLVQGFGWVLVVSTLASMSERALAWRRQRREPSS